MGSQDDRQRMPGEDDQGGGAWMIGRRTSGGGDPGRRSPLILTRAADRQRRRLFLLSFCRISEDVRQCHPCLCYSDIVKADREISWSVIYLAITILLLLFFATFFSFSSRPCVESDRIGTGPGEIQGRQGFSATVSKIYDDRTMNSNSCL